MLIYELLPVNLVAQRPAPLDNPNLDCKPSWHKDDEFYTKVDEANKMLASVDIKQ